MTPETFETKRCVQGRTRARAAQHYLATVPTGPPAPAVGELVTISAGERDRLLATVEHMTPVGADLVAERSPAVTMRELAQLTARMEFAHGEGMWAVAGRLARADAVSEGTAHHLRFYATGEPELMQRRQFVRTDIVTKVSLFTPSGERLRAQTINASGGGMLIAGVPALAIGDEVRFALFLPGCASITGSCRVVRADDDGSRAVRFLSLRRETQHRLMRVLFECQREEALQREEERCAEIAQMAHSADLDDALTLWRNGDVTAASRVLQRAIDAGDPQTAPRAALHLGVLEAERGDASAAIAAYQCAIASGDPQVAPSAALNLGVLFAEHGDPAGAHCAFRSALDSTDPSLRPVASHALASGGLGGHHGHEQRKPAPAPASPVAAELADAWPDFTQALSERGRWAEQANLMQQLSVGTAMLGMLTGESGPPRDVLRAIDTLRARDPRALVATVFAALTLPPAEWDARERPPEAA